MYLLMLFYLTQRDNFKTVRVADAADLCQLENFTKFWTRKHRSELGFVRLLFAIATSSLSLVPFVNARLTVNCTLTQ